MNMKPNGIIDKIRHIFVPTERNNFRARAIHLDFLSYYLMIVLTLSVAFKYVGYNVGGVLGFATDITIQKIDELVNQKRSENGLPTLSYNKKLSIAAASKAQDMFNKNYWSHYSPDGKSPWNFIINSGYKYEYAGENLAKNFVFSQGVVDAWMNSPSHRANLLRKDYTEVGYTVMNGVLNGEETTLVVQMFGKPMEEAGSAFAKPVAAETIDSSTTKTVEVNAKDEEEIVQAPAKAETDTVVLADRSSKPAINLFPTFFGINSLFLIFIALVLSVDLIYAAKMNLLHMNGKHVAHLLFLGFVSVGLSVILLKGSIL